MRNVGLVILALWLLVGAVTQLTGLSFPYQVPVSLVLMIAAGVLLLISVVGGTGREMGILALSLWLVLRGVLQLTGASFQGMTTLEAGLAILAGVLIIMRR